MIDLTTGAYIPSVDAKGCVSQLSLCGNSMYYKER